MKGMEGLESAKGVLQELVVVVSLVRTLTESFGSASELYRKLKKKKHKLIGDGFEELRKPLRKRRDSSSGSDTDSRRRRRPERSQSRKRRNDYSDSDEESIHSSGAMVRAEYDHGYDRLGEKFAIGDVIAQNQLQAQIIAMQQIIIHIYQQCERHPSAEHRDQLLRTSRSARAAATAALVELYQRLLPGPEQRVPGAFPLPSLPSTGSTELVVRKKSTARSRSRGPDRIRENASRHLFCPYALDLQRYPDQPLADSYLDERDGRCPYCRFHIRTRPGKAWEIVLEDTSIRDRDKAFLIGNRFVVKNHREDGGFACVLCTRFRESDTVCKEIPELIDHLWREHHIDELEGDPDVREAG